MAVPDFLRQHVHEADAVIDRALADIVGRQKAVDVVGAQIGDHFRRRHRAQLHVGVGIEPVLGEIIAQKIIVHRIVEGNGELHALPVGRIALVLVLDGKRDALPVDVLDCRHGERDRLRAQAQRDRDRHWRQHVRGVVLLIDSLVADHGPAGGFHHFDVKPVLGIEAERCRHDDRGRAGDRDEADLEVLFFRGACFGESFRRGLDRERIVTARQAPSTHRPISGTRGARRPLETSRAPAPRRRRPRSASLRSDVGSQRNVGAAWSCSAAERCWPQIQPGRRLLPASNASSKVDMSYTP